VPSWNSSSLLPRVIGMEAQPGPSGIPVGGQFDTLRAAARDHYGADAASYEAGRPDYPPQVYALLRDRCGVRSGSRILEIGPGTGQMTRHLLATGAQVVAVEPDPGFCAYLGDHLPQVQVVPHMFEEAEVGDGFDAVVAATSFHWLDQTVALPKVHAVLRPGGWAAIWWTVFSDPYREDPLLDAAVELLGFEPGNQRAGTGFQRDVDARQADLRNLAGLDELSAEVIPWDLTMDAARTRELFNSMITVRQLPDEDRAHVLDTLTTLVDERFGGAAPRPMLTVLYLGRRED
jgi:SAM-dependent methyltransferase